MLRLATFNLCNLGVDAAPGRLERLARIVVSELRSPAILAVQEIKSTVPADALGRVSGDTAYRALAGAVAAAGGPRYEFREVAPLAGRDGGQAGSNIRVGVLFDPAGVAFVDRGTAGPNDATAIEVRKGRPVLTLSPGRIEPGHPAFCGDPTRRWAPSRKALALEFRIANEPLFVIVCHFKSMRAATRREAACAKKQRHAQAEIVHRFAAGLLARDGGAGVVVLGDLNDVPGSRTLKILKGDALDNLLDDLDKRQRYTRCHGERLQALDHVLVSRRLRRGAHVHIPHVNTGCPGDEPASDHDPVLAELDIGPVP